MRGAWGAGQPHESVQRSQTQIQRGTIVRWRGPKIDVDQDLVALVMERYRLGSKREAVNFALRHLVGEPLPPEDALNLEGSGWEGNLDQMR